MSSINHNYTVEIEVLSPLHIGAGSEKDWAENVDFVYDSRNVYKLNQKKVIEHIGIDRFSSIMIGDNRNALKNSLSGNLADFAEAIFQNPGISRNDIKAFIKTGLDNKPYIPGSSLKGAIRSALANYFRPNRTIRNNNELNNSLFGSPTNGDEFMRFVKISDAHFEETVLVNTKIFNLFKTNNQWNGGWKHSFRNETNSTFRPKGFNTIYEVLGQTSISKAFSFSLSEQQVNNFNNNNNRQISQQKQNILKRENDIPKALFQIINDYTKDYIEKEVAFFRKYQNNETQNIIDNLNSIKSNIPEDNSACVLRMSAGSGFHSITGDWKHDVHDIDSVRGRQGQLNGEKSAKSRKISVSGNEFMPMGFVKLRVLTDDEINERKQQEEEQKRIEIRKAKEVAEKRKQQEATEQKCKNLIDKANELFKAEKYAECLNIYSEVLKLQPDNDSVKLKFENIQNILVGIQAEKEKQADLLRQQEKIEAEKTRMAEESRLRRLAEQEKAKNTGIDLSDIDTKNKKAWDNLKNITQRFIEKYTGKKYNKLVKEKKENLLPDAYHQQVLLVVIEIIKNSNIKDKQKWMQPIDKNHNLRKIIEWVGKQKAQQWFSEITEKYE